MSRLVELILELADVIDAMPDGGLEEDLSRVASALKMRRQSKESTEPSVRHPAEGLMHRAQAEFSKAEHLASMSGFSLMLMPTKDGYRLECLDKGWTMDILPGYRRLISSDNAPYLRLPAGWGLMDVVMCAVSREKASDGEKQEGSEDAESPVLEGEEHVEESKPLTYTDFLPKAGGGRV